MAIGYAAPFLTEDMFIGRQKTDFLRRLDREEGWDVYLFGARYLRTENPQERKELLWGMMESNTQTTEETTFTLSLFEDKSAGYEAMRTQLSAAWGEKRTISLLSNVGILEWITAQYQWNSALTGRGLFVSTKHQIFYGCRRWLLVLLLKDCLRHPLYAKGETHLSNCPVLHSLLCPQ